MPRTEKDGDAKVLRQCAGEIAAHRFGNASPVVSLRRRPMRYLGSYDCEDITVRLADGTEFRFFLKDYAFSRRTKDNPVERRERELAVYRDLLASTELGPPEYLGSVWDDSRGRYWLFLELVDGIIIKDRNLEQGKLAASWLGRLHGHCKRHPELLTACDSLIRHDAHFYRSKAAAAIQNVARIDPRSAPLLARIVRRYEPAIRDMVEQPLTLVHGGYIPWHIIVDSTSGPVRVCPIDWELAALGAPLYDLAFFADGMEREARDQVLASYRRSARKHGASIPGRAHMDYLLECYRLHRIFDWLSRSVEKQFPASKVSALVAQAQRQSAQFLV